MNLTATELNIFGFSLVGMVLVLHTLIFLRTWILMTMPPKEANRLNLTIMWTALGLYVLAVGLYLGS